MLNVVGEKAANLVMADTSGKTKALYDVQAPYTIVCFWDPTCGHCQTEVPKLDTLYKTKWKAKGVKMVGVMTEGGMEKWKEFIVKYQLKDWLHIHQNESMKTAERNSGRPGFRQLYDVYQTPTLYLLDKDKKILAKKLNYEQLDEFLGHKFNSH
jgi:peroxiredoxin